MTPPVVAEPIPYDLIRVTIRRLHADGLHAEASRFARRAHIQGTAAEVRALVRGYYPHDPTISRD